MTSQTALSGRPDREARCPPDGPAHVEPRPAPPVRTSARPSPYEDRRRGTRRRLRRRGPVARPPGRDPGRGGARLASLVGRGSGGDLSACRTAAWAAVPDAKSLPTNWTLGSTDLNANGMTISILGPPSADGRPTSPPSSPASRATGRGRGGPRRKPRGGRGGRRHGARPDVERLRLRHRQPADRRDHDPLPGRSARRPGRRREAPSSPSELAQITRAVAAAMGDKTAAGTASIAEGSDDPGAGPSDALGSDEPLPSAFAPELEAILPKSIADAGGAGSPGPDIPLTVQSASATDLVRRRPELARPGRADPIARLDARSAPGRAGVRRHRLDRPVDRRLPAAERRPGQAQGGDHRDVAVGGRQGVKTTEVDARRQEPDEGRLRRRRTIEYVMARTTT